MLNSTFQKISFPLSFFGFWKLRGTKKQIKKNDEKQAVGRYFFSTGIG